MNSFRKSFFLRIVFFVFGVILLSFAGALFIISSKGGDAVTIFNQGLSKYFNLNIGTTITIFNVSMLLIFFFMDRKKIGVGTVIIVIGVGPLTNWFLNIPLMELNEFARYLMVVFASLLGSIGIGFYLYADLGLAALEGIMMFVHKRFHIAIRYIKMSLDAFFILTGYLLGGVVGVGTIFALLTMGPIIDWFYHFLLRHFPHQTKEKGISN